MRMRGVHKRCYGHRYESAATQSVVAGGAEAGDCCGLARSGRFGLACCQAIRRECEPGIQVRKSLGNDPHPPVIPQMIPVVVKAEHTGVTAQPLLAGEKVEIDVAGKYRIRVSGHFDATTPPHPGQGVGESEPRLFHGFTVRGGRTCSTSLASFLRCSPPP